MGLVAAFRLEFRGVGVRLVDIARQHRYLAADVVYFVRNPVRAFVGDRHVVERMHRTFGNVVDVGEVADHVAVVEHLDGFAFTYSFVSLRPFPFVLLPFQMRRSIRQAISGPFPAESVSSCIRQSKSGS